jgi:pyrroloquinoline-quinone synthase
MSANIGGPAKADSKNAATAPCIIAEVRRLLDGRPIVAQEYFTRLQDGSMTKAEFVLSQRQFFHAVRFFSRPIAALVARCPDSTMRMDLVRNLADEQGDFIPSQAHDRTFAAFLKSLGVTGVEVTETAEGPEVRAFNCTLLGACMGAEVELAFGCLGIIEYAFAEISALIGKAVAARGWVRQESIVHYSLHAEIDRRHAEEFFAVIEPAWVRQPEKRPAILQGLELGRHAFARLYADLATLPAP